MGEFIYDFLEPMHVLIILAVIALMLVTLSKGADLLVDEAVSLSVKWGVPKIIIGATIVSIGTTLPEATVSVLAAINGEPGLALGNGIGSMITNTTLIIGLSAMIGALPVNKMIVKRQGKLQIAAAILLAVAAIVPFFLAGDRVIYQWVGWIFVILLAIYIYISIKWSRGQIDENDKPTNTGYADQHIDVDKSPLMVIIVKLMIGIVLVIVSSTILIPAVRILAERVNIPQGIIAATLVAFGTSLPELVTALTAVRKKQGSLAVGNVVGANVLNILFVVGASASVTRGGLKVPYEFYQLHIPTMLLMLVTFYYFSVSNKQRITKNQGFILFLMYIAYLVLNYVIS